MEATERKRSPEQARPAGQRPKLSLELLGEMNRSIFDLPGETESSSAGKQLDKE